MANAMPWSVRGIDPDIREQAVEAAHRSGMSVGQWLSHVLADNLDEEPDDELLPPRMRGSSRKPRRFDTLNERLSRLGQTQPMTAAHRISARENDSAPVLDLIEGAVQALERLEQRAAFAPGPQATASAQPDVVAQTLRAFERKLDALINREISRPVTSGPSPTGHADPDPAFSRTLAEIEARRRDLDGGSATQSKAVFHPQPAFTAPTPEQPRASEPSTSSHIDAMRQQLETLVSRIDDMRAKPPADTSALQGRLDELARRIEEWRVDPRDEISALRRDLTGLAGAIEQMSPHRLVGLVEDATAKLADQALRAEGAGLPERLAEPLERVHEDVRAVLREVSSSRGTDRLSQEVGNLARRLDQLSQTAPDPARIDDLVRETGAIKTLVNQAIRAQPFEGLAHQIEALSQQVEKFQKAPGAGTDRQVLDAIRDVGDRLERIDPRTSFAAIETRLGAIAGLESKLDEIARGMKKLAKEAQPLPQLETIAERLERIDRVLDKSGGKPIAGLDLLAERLDKVGASLDRAATTQPAEHDALVGMLEKLSQRMDQAQTAQAGSPALDALQDEIARLASRMEKMGGAPAGLDGIERGVSDLFAHIDQVRKDMHDAAETTAFRAAQEAVKNAPRDESSDALAAEGLLLIKRDLNEFKTAQSDADRRTRQTLEALHGTLETLVGRLSDIETRAPTPASAPVSRTEPKPIMPAATPMPAPVSQVASTPSLDLQIPPTGQIPHASAALDLASDLPLEPGVRPSQGEPASADHQTNFIAAARRLTQAAAARSQATLTEDSAPVAKPVRGGKSTAAMPDAGMTSFIVRARKPMLLGMAAIIFSFGALKIVNNRSVVPAATPTSSQPERPAINRQLDQPGGPAVKPQELPGEGTETTGSIGNGRSFTGQQIPIVQPGNNLNGKRSQRLSDPSTGLQSDPMPTGGIGAASPAPSVDPGRAALEELVAQSGLRPQDRLREAALQGNTAALYELGTRSADGKGAARDPKLAARWFEQAAALGHGPSQYRLGALYREGRGVPKDSNVAYQWFDRAAAQGNVLAMHNAAVLLAEGVNGTPDYAGAALWFKRAAEHGIKDSQFNVAILFARGLGVNQDLAESFRWFAIAALQGDQDAIKKRDDIAGRMTKEQITKETERAKAFKPIQANSAANEAGIWDKTAKAGT